MNRRIFSIVLLVIVFLAGFSMSYLFKEEWKCPSCSFDSSDRIVPLINEQCKDTLFSEISNAKSEINILMYEMKFYTTNSTVRQLEDLLIKKKEEGIKIRVILDQSEWNGQITSLTKDNEKSLNYLKENGIDVKFDDKKITTHDKLLIIDDKTIIIGSHNWGYSALNKNNEASILVESKEIAEYYNNYFESLWKKY